VLDRHEDFDVNQKNFKGEFALGLAVRHKHAYVVEAIFKLFAFLKIHLAKVFSNPRHCFTCSLAET
jgi:hypothetical protein